LVLKKKKVRRERDFLARVIVPVLDSILPGARVGCRLESIEVYSASSAARKNRGKNPTVDVISVGRAFDYVATLNVGSGLEIFFVEVAGGIEGGNVTKVGKDKEKLLVVMKDTLDFYVENLKIDKKNDLANCTVYSMLINGRLFFSEKAGTITIC
jgi:hypothetical protein